jgi:hypothetical protein
VIRARQSVARATKVGFILAGAFCAYAGSAAAQSPQGPPAPVSSAAQLAQPEPAPPPKQGWSFNPDAGFVYQSGDFKLTTWGFAERIIDTDGPDSFRRVRQGAEFDFPRVTRRLRPAFVYEIDLTDTNAFGINPGPAGSLNSHNFENLFLALQDVDDPGRFRLLVGENTHILSRDDNLSSGNLPTINRSLILEEHGSVGSFGTQFGVQFQKAVSDKLTVQLAAMDNRGSFNQAVPRYQVGNSLSGKLILVPVNDAEHGRKLTLGLAVDHTRDIGAKTFTLGTAITLTPVGGVAASGDKLTWEADAAYTFSLLGRPTTLEAEAMRSRFSGSRSDVAGGYGMVQWSAFDTPAAGDLDLFVRYDLVSAGQDVISGRATQRAWRTGFNYNLPHTNKLVSLHLEQAHSTLSGPMAIVTDDRNVDEFRLGVRVSLQRYQRH